MNLRSLRAFAALLALPLLLSAGCSGNSDLPPGGAPAVAYWQAVLLQYPDLPEKVQAIVDRRGHLGWLGRSLPQCEVTIHGQDEIVSVTGRHVDVVVTDLGDAALRKLLSWWESVPRWARDLDIQTTLPFTLPSSTRHVVVLGHQGRIEVAGPDGSDRQSINILADETFARTTIGVHAFGPEGDAALEHLAGQYNQVRGPPRSAVKAGRISLPPPEENVTVLVIGRLGRLDIDGPSDDAQQDISFAGYLNRHESSGQVAGVLAGTPFGSEPSYVAERPQPAEDSIAGPQSESSESSPAGGSSFSGNRSEAVALPGSVTLPGNLQLPRPIELPHNDFRTFQPPTTIHMPPPVMYQPPVMVPHFR